MARVWFQLVPQPEDEIVDRARQRCVRVAPHQVQQLVPCDDAAGPFREASQNLELPVGQLHAFGAAMGSKPPEVDDGLAERQLVDSRLRPAQHGVDPRKELVERERLGDVIVGSECQAADAILLLAARRQPSL